MKKKFKPIKITRSNFSSYGNLISTDDINPMDINGKLKGKSILAIDTVQAGVGDTVIVIDEGGSAKIVLGAENVTVRTIVAGIVDEINTKYVSKEEFNALVRDVNNFKTLVAKELKGSSRKTSKTKSNNRSSSEIAKSAKAYFDKKYYTNAIKDYELLISKNYKPAYAHYMIGEMNYKRKNYSNAISYFKKSSSLYSKASYMPKLMLHTALSMQESGDSGHAKAFFGAIVSKYPSSAEAKEAKLYLQP